MAEQLSQRCDGSHTHQQLWGRSLARAAQYPDKLCRAICRGIILQKRERTEGMLNLLDTSHEWARDDVSYTPLQPQEVVSAREEEMKYVRQMGVWEVIPREQAYRSGWKVITTRWIDINKGYDQGPNYRSRLVAQEYNNSAAGHSTPDNFAATPPLETLRRAVSVAAQARLDGDQASIMVLDVKRAFFEADTERYVCVEIPKEYWPQSKDKADIVGKLRKSL